MYKQILRHIASRDMYRKINDVESMTGNASYKYDIRVPETSQATIVRSIRPSSQQRIHALSVHNRKILRTLYAKHDVKRSRKNQT